jgi:hypothetical protein
MRHSTAVVVDVGDVPVLLRTFDASLVSVLERRFGRFLNASAAPVFEFDVTVVPDQSLDADADLEVRYSEGCWTVHRGDFRAQWNAADRHGWIRQTVSPYAVDSVLRIVHTLVLSTAGGFLLHASSAVRAGRAFVFTGPSGAGKSTIAALAPPDTTVLTDEISYVKWTDDDGYVAYGTPFAGERGEGAQPLRAPIAALFTLDRGDTNYQERLDQSSAVRALMRNILFFAADRELVNRVFDTACHFASVVPALRLVFVPDARVWETIA